MAAWRPKVGPPVSRTVVKPRIRVLCASATAFVYISPVSAVDRSCIVFGAKTMCQWASVRPGISTRPPPSILVLPCGGVIVPEETCLILRSETRTLPDLGWAPVPSKIRTLLMSIGPAGVAARLGACCARAAAAIAAKPPARANRVDLRVKHTAHIRGLISPGTVPACTRGMRTATQPDAGVITRSRLPVPADGARRDTSRKLGLL